MGLSETNMPWNQVPHLPADFRACLRRQFHSGKAIFSSPNSTVDPVKSTAAFQAGGNFMFTIGALVPMLLNSSTEPLTDPTGMGRWCGMTVRGRNGNQLSVITAYLRRIQRDSEGHRQHNLYAILAKYEAGGTSLSPSKVQRRSAGIRNTLTNEACRGMYANIRNQTKKGGKIRPPTRQRPCRQYQAEYIRLHFPPIYSDPRRGMGESHRPSRH